MARSVGLRDGQGVNGPIKEQTEAQAAHDQYEQIGKELAPAEATVDGADGGNIRRRSRHQKNQSGAYRHAVRHQRGRDGNRGRRAHIEGQRNQENHESRPKRTRIGENFEGPDGKKGIDQRAHHHTEDQPAPDAGQQVVGVFDHRSQTPLLFLIRRFYGTEVTVGRIVVGQTIGDYAPDQARRGRSKHFEQRKGPA